MKQQSKETEDFVYFDFILHNNVHSLDRYNACHIEFKLVSFVKGLSILQWRAYPHFYQDITTIQTQVSWSDYRNFNNALLAALKHSGLFRGSVKGFVYV